MWENINELLPTGRRAVPIISSWENTRGKKDGETDGEGGRDEKRSNLAFLFPLIRRRARLCAAAEHTLWVHYCDGKR